MRDFFAFKRRVLHMRSSSQSVKYFTMQHTMVNTWVLQSFSVRLPDGQVIYPFGQEVMGSLVYTSSWDFSVQLMKKDRPLFTSGDQMKGTPDEIEAAFKGVIAYYGRYSVDEKEGIITHEVEGSLFPNWMGRSMIRYAKFDHDTLSLSTPPTRFGGAEAVATLVWKIKR
jgi:hypothetical protein